MVGADIMPAFATFYAADPRENEKRPRQRRGRCNRGAARYFFAAIMASRLARNALVSSQFGQLPSLATVLPTM